MIAAQITKKWKSYGIEYVFISSMTFNTRIPHNLLDEINEMIQKVCLENSYHYNPYKTKWRIPKLILIAHKKYLYCLRWNIFFKGVVYLMIHTYSYFNILMHKWRYSFIYYLITQVISFYQLNFWFFFSPETSKEYRKFQTFHLSPYCVNKK